MLIIAGYVHVDPSHLDEFIADARATYAVAAKNVGNRSLSFSVHDQSTGTVTVLEQWNTAGALAQHLATPEVTEIFVKWGPRMRNEVRMFDATNERDPRA